MLIVSPVQTQEEREKLCRLCNTTLREGSFMYVANVDDRPVGIAQFEIKGDYAVINDLASVEGKYYFEAMFIMGRQTLNFCDLCGSHDAYLDDGERADMRLRTAIGFKKLDDNRWYMDLRGFFEEHCKSE